MIDLFVIDDHPVVIDGLISVFKDGHDNIRVTGSANSAEEALPKLVRSKANIVILDLLMPGISGVDFCLKLKKEFPRKKVIILTGESGINLLYNVWINRADAILLKHSGKDELVDAIRGVMSGRRIIGSNVPDFMIPHKTIEQRIPKLTNREHQILTLLAKGMTRGEVARMLGSSVDAVNFHCKNLFRKFDQNKLVSVVDEARNLGLIE